MRLRDIFGDANERESAAPGPSMAGEEDLAGLRQAGERFLAAGDEAISLALSGDSERFLASNRQQSGQ